MGRIATSQTRIFIALPFLRNKLHLDPHSWQRLPAQRRDTKPRTR